jgi:hypothetical protein
MDPGEAREAEMEPTFTTLPPLAASRAWKARMVWRAVQVDVHGAAPLRIAVRAVESVLGADAGVVHQHQAVTGRQ